MGGNPRRVLGDAGARCRGWPPGRRRPRAALRCPPVAPHTCADRHDGAAFRSGAAGFEACGTALLLGTGFLIATPPDRDAPAIITTPPNGRTPRSTTAALRLRCPERSRCRSPATLSRAAPGNRAGPRSAPVCRLVHAAPVSGRMPLSASTAPGQPKSEAPYLWWVLHWGTTNVGFGPLQRDHHPGARVRVCHDAGIPAYTRQ